MGAFASTLLNLVCLLHILLYVKLHTEVLIFSNSVIHKRVLIFFSQKSVSSRRRQSCRMFDMKSFCWRWPQSSGHHMEHPQCLPPWALPHPVVQGGNCHVPVPPIRKFRLHQSLVHPHQVNIVSSLMKLLSQTK
jgi:hypothetical protein